ncbi:MAG: hypothetical protein RLZZ602_1402, partial [Pseudomonadota bacterium]
RYEGFISVDVIRPGEGDGLEYTTLVKFDSCDNLKRWRDSTSLANWLVDLPELTVPLGPQDYGQHQQAE